MIEILTIENILAIFVLFISGYVIGSSIKSGVKYVSLFLIFFIFLFSFGILSKNAIQNVSEGLSVLKPIADFIKSFYPKGGGGMTIYVASFVLGLSIGFMKG